MISFEQDQAILVVISQLLSDVLSKCSAEKYPEVLSVIEKLLSSISQEQRRDNLQDIEIVVDALIKVFKVSLS